MRLRAVLSLVGWLVGCFCLAFTRREIHAAAGGAVVKKEQRALNFCDILLALAALSVPKRMLSANVYICVL